MIETYVSYLGSACGLKPIASRYLSQNCHIDGDWRVVLPLLKRRQFNNPKQWAVIRYTRSGDWQVLFLELAYFGGESDEVLSPVNYAWWHFTIRCMNACNDGRWYVNREKSKTEKFTRQKPMAKFQHDFQILPISSIIIFWRTHRRAYACYYYSVLRLPCRPYMYFNTDYNCILFLFLYFKDLLMAKVACCIKLIYLIEGILD